jgi:hypothetical protein
VSPDEESPALRPFAARLVACGAAAGATPRVAADSERRSAAHCACVARVRWRRRPDGLLSEPLTSAGFLVVAFDHHGNNFVDGHLAEGFARWWERPLDLAFALDRLAERIVLGPVGAAGFSLGGYSAAALLGARVDADLYAALLSGAVRVPPPPEYPELEQELRARLSENDIAAWVADAGRDYSDGRAQAAPNGSAPTHTPHLRLAGTLRRFDSCPANPAGAKGGQPEMGSLRLVRCPAESGRGRDCGTRRPASSLHPGPLGTTPV